MSAVIPRVREGIGLLMPENRQQCCLRFQCLLMCSIHSSCRHADPCSQTLDGGEKPKLMRRASAMLNDTLHPITTDPPPALQRSPSNDPFDANPLLMKLARRESMRRSVCFVPPSTTTKPASPPSPTSRRGSIKEPRLLNKSKISYRDAIEG